MLQLRKMRTLLLMQRPGWRAIQSERHRSSDLSTIHRVLWARCAISTLIRIHRSHRWSHRMKALIRSGVTSILSFSDSLRTLTRRRRCKTSSSDAWPLDKHQEKTYLSCHRIPSSSGFSIRHMQLRTLTFRSRSCLILKEEQALSIVDSTLPS